MIEATSQPEPATPTKARAREAWIQRIERLREDQLLALVLIVIAAAVCSLPF